MSTSQPISDHDLKKGIYEEMLEQIYFGQITSLSTLINSILRVSAITSSVGRNLQSGPCPQF